MKSDVRHVTPEALLSARSEWNLRSKKCRYPAGTARNRMPACFCKISQGMFKIYDTNEVIGLPPGETDPPLMRAEIRPTVRSNRSFCCEKCANFVKSLLVDGYIESRGQFCTS